jgi:phosphoglycolate phosphatase
MSNSEKDRPEAALSTTHAWPLLVIDSVVFDLDGTLWDTCAACAVGWNRVLNRHRIPFRTITAEDVRGVAGKPHDLCIQQVFHELDPAAVAILTEETASEDNQAIAELGGNLYPGVKQGLAELAAALPLFIVSNCQAGYIELFLEQSGLGALFQDVECWGNTGLSKADNLQRLIDRNRLAAPILVGDTQGDQQAAQACAIPFVHASYGFGSCPAAARCVASFAQLVHELRAQVAGSGSSASPQP